MTGSSRGFSGKAESRWLVKAGPVNSESTREPVFEIQVEDGGWPRYRLARELHLKAKWGGTAGEASRPQRDQKLIFICRLSETNCNK